MANEAKVEAKVASVGVDAKGRSVVRLYINGSSRVIETNVKGLAELAAAGVKVINGG